MTPKGTEMQKPSRGGSDVLFDITADVEQGAFGLFGDPPSVELAGVQIARSVDSQVETVDVVLTFGGIHDRLLGHIVARELDARTSLIVTPLEGTLELLGSVNPGEHVLVFGCWLEDVNVVVATAKMIRSRGGHEVVASLVPATGSYLGSLNCEWIAIAGTR